jgi:uncharacterized membrane protein YeiH
MFTSLLATDLIAPLNIVGTIVFAMTGAISAARKRFDLFGLVVFAALVGLGGGTLRDILLGRLPVFWVLAPWNLALTTAVAILSFFMMRWITRFQRIFIWADALGLATFAIVGSAVSLEVGVSPYLAPLFGVFTGCFGGLLRDVIANERPLILYAELYASAALAAGAVYVGLLEWGLSSLTASILALAAGMLLRAASIIWGLHLPRAMYPR